MSTPGGYDPKQIETEVRALWERGRYFHAEGRDRGSQAAREQESEAGGARDQVVTRDSPLETPRRPFTIIMPPPNVTGALHLGHSLYTIQDVLTRWKRMQGFEALYMPGLDHAGIATQAVVEKRLRETEGKTRKEIGREALVERIWKWKDEYGERISNQLKMLGVSADWRRSRFTLDEVCARAVYHTFFEFFKAGLIYRGERLVNWDAFLETAVADDEIEHLTVKTSLWHLRYPIEGSRMAEDYSRGRVERPAPPTEEEPAAAKAKTAAGDELEAGYGPYKLGQDYLIVATTRPETMLGDTAVAVHPDDERYQHLIGKQVVLPLMNRRIPVIADPILVKMGFGTGCVKVTPAHDPNDYDCGKRNGLRMINILTKDGMINENGVEVSDGATERRSDEGNARSNRYDYRGMKKEDARKKVVADLDALGLLGKVQPYETEVGHSDRSKTPIEPILSEQWFVKMDTLAELAMAAVRDGRMRFVPERYAKTYLDWLGEKRDWCISRQLWWGHRIPVWRRRPGASSEDFQQLTASQQKERLDAASEIRTAMIDGRIAIGESDAWYAVSDEIKQAFAASGHIPDELLTRLVLSSDTKLCPRADYLAEFARLAELDGWEQDPDVLDTWFSSSLWPLSTLGWPQNDSDKLRVANSELNAIPESPSVPSSLRASVPTLEDYEFFYPTDVLCTGRGIISLWVARMVIMGLAFDERGELNFRGRVPFSHVYINPTILDGQGAVMSKTKGNGVDPLDIITLYGTDALRLTMASLAGDTQDIRIPVAYRCPHCEALTPMSSIVPKGKFPIDVKKAACGSCKKPFATQWADAATKAELGVALESSERFEAGRNFVNKLWQAATGFILPNASDAATQRRSDGGEHAAVGWVERSETHRSVWDRWILARLNAAIVTVTSGMEAYQFQRVCDTLRDFFWSDFCDWYIEEAKVRLQDPQQSAGVKGLMLHVLDSSLRLLHPFVPFVTEAIWQQMNAECGVQDAQDQRAAATATKHPALCIAAWPSPAANVDAEWEAPVRDVLQPVIRSLRDALASLNASRSQAKQSALGKLPRALIRANAAACELLRGQLATLLRLGRCEVLEIGESVAKPSESLSRVLTGIEVYVPVAGLMDLDAERKKLAKEKLELAGHRDRLVAKLSNEGFVAKAPADVITSERQRLMDLTEKLESLERNLADLS